MNIAGKFGIFYEKDTLNVTLFSLCFLVSFFHFISSFFAFLYTLINHFVLEVTELFADISYLCFFTLFVTRTENATQYCVVDIYSKPSTFISLLTRPLFNRKYGREPNTVEFPPAGRRYRPRQ
jgi:hypothetical protein